MRTGLETRRSSSKKKKEKEKKKKQQQLLTWIQRSKADLPVVAVID